MTYNRIGTPRAYVDRLSFDLANGWRTAANYTVLDASGSAVTFDGEPPPCDIRRDPALRQ